MGDKAKSADAGILPTAGYITNQLGVAGVAAALGILFFVIAKLSRKVNRRNWHIAELEELAGEEDEKKKSRTLTVGYAA
ncbi:MAG: hypothetical protein NTW29_10550 [Bacteroidetes bacterium]|nr:hypothetical protein [Bacteroidota bacterium]